MELIKVNYQTEQPTVLGRDLHEFLEVSTAYKDWFPRMCEYGFTDKIDYCTFLSESTGGRPSVNHQLTIDMAKEISMIQRNEKGKQARQYFIACEKRLMEQKSLALPKDYLSALKALVASEETRIQQQAQLTEQKPLVEFAESVSKSVNSISVGEFAKLVADEEIKIGQNRLFKWFRESKYLNKENVPYQEFIERGYFEVIEQTFDTPYGTKTKPKTLITGKGQIYFVEKLRKLY